MSVKTKQSVSVQPDKPKQELMTVTFFINYLNHHQLYVADEMYRLLGRDFHYVATYPRNPQELKGDTDFSDRPYCLLPAENGQDKETAHILNRDSDVCVFGAGNLEWEKERAACCKLSFEISERWLKNGILNLLSPRLLKWWWLYQTKLRQKPFYKLCASGFAAKDCSRLLTFRNRCYKWGYFTNISEQITTDYPSDKLKIMWCGRLIDIKHPEMAIQLAHRLKKNGYDFELTLYGEGELRAHIEKMISTYSLESHVSLMGNVPNPAVHQAMRSSHIFLFTSDRREGWGAVINEAMGNRCCVVADRHIGATPYLLKDGINGMVYDGDGHTLYEKVKFLFDNPRKREDLANNAYKDMLKYWNPKNAASSLLYLIENLIHGHDTSIIEGPCSKA